MSGGFSFGQPSSSGTSLGSLFGTSGSSGNAGGNLLGGGSTSFSFGGQGQNTSSSAGEPKSLFSGPTDNKSGANLFGQQSGGNLFGKPSSSGASTGSTPAFSFAKKDEQGPNSGSSSIFGTPKGPSPAFGASTTPAATTSQQPWSFGNPSTTPAGPPPQPQAFGASTGGSSNIFGNNKTAQDNTSKAPTFSITKPDNNSANSSALSSLASTPNTLFGAPQSAQGTASAAPSLFAPPPKPAEKSAEQPSASSGTSTGQKPLFQFQQTTPQTQNSTSGSSTPSLFGAPTSKPAASPSLFGASPATTQAPASQSSAPSLFSPAATTSWTESTHKPAFSFPGASSQPQAAPTPATSAEPSKPFFATLGGATSSAAPSKPLFGAAPASSAGQTPATTATAPSSTPAFSFGPSAAPSNQASTTQAPSSTSGLAASTSGPLPQAQSRLKNKTMDEILTRWATDLTKYTKEFKNHAETVAKWDQVIVDNSSKIDKLYVKTRTCEKQTMSVEMQLSAVENQQTELESWLTKYENDVEAMLSKEGATPSELGGPDQDRERTYKMAERLDERLTEMGKDLSSMVDEVNAANAGLSKNGKADEPITQIVRILNSHLSQLQAIDQGTAALQTRVAEAQKTANGLGYLNGGANGVGRAAVDDFYRSYMGRR